MIGFRCICLYQDTFFMTYHQSGTQIGHFMERETVYCDLNSKHGWGRGLSYSRCQVAPWAVKQSTYVTTFGGSAKLVRLECKRIPKEVPFNRLARASKKNPRCQPPYPRCQPPDFCYQLCTPKGVHNCCLLFFGGFFWWYIVYKSAFRYVCTQ